MEERKQKEKKYYDLKAEEQISSENIEGDFEGFNPFLLSSFNFLKDYMEDKCGGKKVLDYGCGNGVHSWWLAKFGADLDAIDLSEKSLEIARKKAEKEGVAERIRFREMDAEKLEFPNNYFDIVFDGGTFSSLDLKKAFPEISRVLKPGGFLAGIETFGHNPIANLKRLLNKMLGKRTGWAAAHIFKVQDIELAKSYFSKTEVYFFHIVSWLAIPVLSLNFGKNVLKILEKADRVILAAFPFLGKYSFKVVFIFRK